MKWLDDPPADWERAPGDPPPGRTESPGLRVDRLVNGVVLSEPGTPGAYVFTDGGSVAPSDRA